MGSAPPAAWIRGPHRRARLELHKRMADFRRLEDDGEHPSGDNMFFATFAGDTSSGREVNKSSMQARNPVFNTGGGPIFPNRKIHV